MPSAPLIYPEGDLEQTPCPACREPGWLFGSTVATDIVDLRAAHTGAVLLAPAGFAPDGGIACLACGWEAEAGPRPPAH